MTAAQPTIDPPSKWLLLSESQRTLNALQAYFVALPFLQTAPRGDGHPVLVLPGFLTSDLSTMPLRLFLRSRGYKTYGWGQGRNLGRGIDAQIGIPDDSKVLAMLRDIYAETGRKVSLIGWSLGGIYARELARIEPEMVRQVITMGSPFNGDASSSTIGRLFERVSGHKVGSMNPDLRAQLHVPPPVPTTAIYSRSDGIAAWQACIEKVGLSPDTENIEVVAAHTAMGFHPVVLWTVAERLAQREGEWQPFKRQGVKRFVYPKLPEAASADADAASASI